MEDRRIKWIITAVIYLVLINLPEFELQFAPGETTWKDNADASINSNTNTLIGRNDFQHLSSAESWYDPEKTGQPAQSAGIHKLKVPHGLSYIGRGYNLLYGNPTGVDPGHMSLYDATDPGVQLSRILQLTWRTNRTDETGRVSIPDQVDYELMSHCMRDPSTRMFAGVTGYQERMKSAFQPMGGFEIESIANVSFIMNNPHLDKEGEVIIHAEKFRACAQGTARYRMNNDKSYLNVHSDFQRAVCGLPRTYEGSERLYKDFINTFGTNIITYVILGSVNMKRGRVSSFKLMNLAIEKKRWSLKLGGPWHEYNHTIVLDEDVNNLVDYIEEDSKLVENVIRWQMGSHSHPVPVLLGLINLHKALMKKFWEEPCKKASEVGEVSGAGSGDTEEEESSATNLDYADCCSRLRELRTNVRRALEDYPAMMNLTLPTENKVRIPITWPKGYYGLPSTRGGCPEETSMKWVEGIRQHTTHESSEFSDLHHITGIDSNKKYLFMRTFCMKANEQTTKYDREWPPGDYCLYKKTKCPQGMTTGFIAWDDRNVYNDNKFKGIVPDGEYDHNTKIEYCCRADGAASNKIFLPISRPFYLVQRSSECQQVWGTKVRTEWEWLDSNDWCKWCSRGWQMGGLHPRNAYSYENNKIFYCYYESTA